MPGQPNRGKLRGKRPENAHPPFRKGDPETIALARKAHAKRLENIARFKSLRDAAEALRDIPSSEWPNMSNGVAAVMGVYKAASDGDAKSLNVLAQLMGEMVEKVDVQNLPIIRDDIPRMPDPQKSADE